MNASDAVVMSAIEREGSGPTTVVRLHRSVESVENDATALAYAAAVAEAGPRAGAIASADGRRIGRLLNVQPLPTNLLDS
jgi:hypothetical protein